MKHFFMALRSLWYLLPAGVLSLFFSLLELFTIEPCFRGFLCLILDLVFGLPVFRFHLVPAHLFVVGDVAVVQHYSSFLPVTFMFSEIYLTVVQSICNFISHLLHTSYYSSIIP